MDTAQTVRPFHNKFILKILIDRRYRLARHLALILLLAAGIYNSRVEFSDPMNTYARILMFATLLGLFYINMYSLVPKLLFKDNYLGYFLWIFGFYLLIPGLIIYAKHFIYPYVNPINHEPHDEPNLFAISFIFCMLFGSSAAIKLFQRWIADSQRINELETATVQSELEQLKKQINPHFLFNMLNNANVLTQIDPAKASQLLMKLSDLLRYQLYDCTKTNVFLTSEMQFLEDFLNLEMIRRDNFDFTLTQEGAVQGIEIAPLLFITFVENAIKHNIDAEERSFVYVFFAVTDQELQFHCLNSKPRIQVARNANGGLGLTNVMRRLELLYPDCHELKVTDNLDTFNVHLMIKL